MSRHIVVGGTGFIGHEVVQLLHSRGDNVLVLARHPSRPSIDKIDGVEQSQPEMLVADYTEVEWSDLLEPGDIVHHYACSFVPRSANADPIADLDSSVRGSVRMFKALSKLKNSRLVFASSGGTVYGRLRAIPVSEDHALDPITAYGVSKLAIEKYAGVFHSCDGLDVRIARIANPFGARQSPEKMLGAASIFLQHAIENRPITIWGDGSAIRDYLHISDVAAALQKLADLPAEELQGHQVFNVGSGRGVSLNAIIEYLRRRVDANLAVHYEDRRSFDVDVSVLDISRARVVLGWAPLLSFEEGMDRVLYEFGLRDGMPDFFRISA